MKLLLNNSRIMGVEWGGGVCVRACVCVCGGGGRAVLDDNHNTECVWFCLVCCDAVYRTFLPTCASPRLWFEGENLSVRSRLRSVLCLNVVHCCATNYLCIDWWPGRHLCSLSVSFSVPLCLSVRLADCDVLCDSSNRTFKSKNLSL